MSEINCRNIFMFGLTITLENALHTWTKKLAEIWSSLTQDPDGIRKNRAAKTEERKRAMIGDTGGASYGSQ